MILLIDNYDSFTYNLYQYMSELGAEVEVVRNDKTSIEDIDVMDPEKIVISPGPCTPKEAGISVPLIKHFAGKKPLLGVCLGHECIGEAFGGVVGSAGDLIIALRSSMLRVGCSPPAPPTNKDPWPVRTPRSIMNLMLSFKASKSRA